MSEAPVVTPRRNPPLRRLRLWLAGLVGSRYDGLYNFHVVEPGVLLRCGQPRTTDLDEIRARYGLRTVICARGGTRHPLRGRWFHKETRWCREHGVELVHMPFSDAATPPAEVFDRFLSIVRDPARRPVLVHCEQGFHRTGVLCATYRVVLAGWTRAQALAEMAALGFELDRDKRRPLVDALDTYLAAVATSDQPRP